MDEKRELVRRGLDEGLADAVNHLFQVARSNYGHGAIEKFEKGLELSLSLYDQCGKAAERMLEK